MPRRLAILSAAGFVAGVAVASAAYLGWQRRVAERPLGTIDFRDIHGYVSRLNRSTRPDAQALRQAIASGPRDLAAQRAAARAEGIPLSADQIRVPPVPSGQDASPDYVALAVLLKRRPLDRDAEFLCTKLGPQRHPTSQQLAAVRALLDRRQDVMRLVHQAAGRPGCSFRREWGRSGAYTAQPEQATMRTASRLLAGESLLLARQGLWDRAVANQACCLRIAAHAASEPPLLSFLVGVGIEMTALRGMEDILRLAGPNARVAGLVARAVLAGRPRLRLRDALSGDLAVYGEWTFRGFRRSEPEVFQLLQMDPEQLTAAVSATGRAPDVRRQGLDPADRRFVADLVDASQAAYLGDMRRAIAVADQPQWQRAVAMAAATAASLPRDDPRRVLRSQVMPDCAMAAKHEAALHAREACLIAGTALLAWRARRGSFPGSGSDPGAPAPTDAFTGRPLSYRREGAGFVVYSVGPTGHFDGGRPGQEPGADEAVFRWP